MVRKWVAVFQKKHMRKREKRNVSGHLIAA